MSELADLALPPGALRRFGHAQLRAPFGLERIAADPRGRLVVASGRAETALWDLARGERRPWLEHTAAVRCLGFLEGGARWLLLDGDDGVVHDAASDEELVQLRPPGAVLAAALSADGRRLVALCEGGRLVTLSPADGSTLADVRTKLPAAERLALAVDRTGSRALVFVDHAGPALLLDPATGEVLHRPAPDEDHELRAATLAPDGARLLLVTTDRREATTRLELRDADDGALLASTRLAGPGDGWGWTLAVEGDLVACAASGSGTVALLDARTLVARWTTRVPSWAAALAFAGDALWLACPAAAVALDLATGAERPLAPGPHRDVRRLRASGRHLVVLADPHRPLVHDLATGDVLGLPSEEAMDCALAPDGARVVVSDSQQRLSIRRLADGAVERTADLPPHELHASLAWSPDGRTIAAGTYVGKVLLLDAKRLAVRATLDVSAGVVDRLAWTPSGHLLVTGEMHRVPRLFTAEGARAGKVAWREDDVWGWQVVDDERLFTWHGDTVRAWSLPQGRRLGEWAVNGTGEQRCHGFAVAPGGGRIAWSSHYLRAVRVVELPADATSPPRSAVAGEHEGGCPAVAFGPDGRLFSGASDGTVVEWDLATLVPEATPRPAPRARPAARRPRRRAPATIERPASAVLDGLLLGRQPPSWSSTCSRLAIRKGGALAVPDGRLVVADPMLADGADPFEVPPGRHPVCVAVERHDTVGPGEPVGALVRFRPGRPVAWRSPFGVRGGRPLGASVDSATLLLCGAARAGAIQEDSDDLEALFATAADEQRALAARGWALAGPRGSNALVLRTGSDGGYPALLGLDAKGRPVVLAVPFRYDRPARGSKEKVSKKKKRT